MVTGIFLDCSRPLYYMVLYEILVAVCPRDIKVLISSYIQDESMAAAVGRGMHVNEHVLSCILMQQASLEQLKLIFV